MNRLIKEGLDTDPVERGEKDKDLERGKTTAYFPKSRREKRRSSCLR